MGKKPKDEVSDEEAERRATEALRRALSTPPRPQSDMKLGKRVTKKATKRKR
jgi:hypothetical protein